MSDDLVTLGKQNGTVIADYVVSRMQAGNMSPAQAVEALPLTSQNASTN
jgi:hypothetical protein